MKTKNLVYAIDIAIAAAIIYVAVAKAMVSAPYSQTLTAANSMAATASSGLP